MLPKCSPQALTSKALLYIPMSVNTCNQNYYNMGICKPANQLLNADLKKGLRIVLSLFSILQFTSIINNNKPT